MPVRFRLAVFLFPKPRSSQVVRQRSHTPRIAGSNPASATIFRIVDHRSWMMDVIALQPRSTICDPLSIFRARGSQQTRLVWSEEVPGAAPGRATNLIHILRSSIAEHPLDKRKTAAQYRAEGPSPVMSKQHARLLTGSSWCKSTLGSQFPMLTML